MQILIIGGGGREHAMARKIASSPLCTALYIAPGNPGMSKEGTVVNINISDFDSVGAFCVQHKIDMVVVGPEVPLAEGISDYFASHPDLKEIAVIGPGRAGAMLESSKDFSKQFMIRNGIPTARAKSFTKASVAEAEAFIRSLPVPVVLKADGLAAGKGVVIPATHEEAIKELHQMLDGRFGVAGHVVLIEEFLTGIELSVFVLTNGKAYVLLPEAKDYKRIGEWDTGPNTGGMGSVSPVPFADAAFMDKVTEKVIKPTISGLAKEKIPYTGFIFFGLIKVGEEPFVIEYNCRMGDPETESVMPRLKEDLVQMMLDAAKGNLETHVAASHPDFAVCTMLVSGGYPDEYEKGFAITNLPVDDQHLHIYHAGTATQDGVLVNKGGRVIAVTAMAPQLREAIEHSQRAAESIVWQKRYYRRDIGQDLLRFLQ